MRDDNFYCVYGWMVNRLHLKGSGLALFAVVYGLIRRDERRGGSGEIELSLAYASEGTGLTERQTRRELNKLTESWILERTTRDGKRSVFKLSYSTKIAIAKREDILSRQTPDILSPLSPKNGDKERGEDILSENPGHFVPPS